MLRNVPRAASRSSGRTSPVRDSPRHRPHRATSPESTTQGARRGRMKPGKMTSVRWVAAAVLVLALAAHAAAAPARHYEGSGPRTLAPFPAGGPATLRWQTSGGLIGGLLAVKLLNARVDVPNPQIVF